jgi:hypothetical protein
MVEIEQLMSDLKNLRYRVRIAILREADPSSRKLIEKAFVQPLESGRIYHLNNNNLISLWELYDELNEKLFELQHLKETKEFAF